MQLEVSFHTQYRYDPPAGAGLTALRLLPSDRPGQRVTSARIHASPGHHSLTYTDAWGTRVDLFELRSSHNNASFHAHATIETSTPEVDIPPTEAELAIYGASSARVPLDSETGLDTWTLTECVVSWPAVMSIVAWIPQRFAYRVGLTDAGTTLDEFLAIGAGVCQDFAHLLLGILRRCGWCARYVSGYFFSAPREHETIEAEASHAWVEVYRPGIGWVGLDATAGTYADDRYVVVGTGRDYLDVAPVRGVIAGRGEQSHTSRLEMVQGQPEQ